MSASRWVSERTWQRSTLESDLVKIQTGLIHVCGRIPRAEVEEMGRVVTRELEELEPGCVSTIAGGCVSPSLS